MSVVANTIDGLLNRKIFRALKDKIILVTGASSGIGLDVAKMIGEAKGTAILVARSIDKLEEAKLEVEKAGGNAFIYSCDITNEESAKNLIEQVAANHGHIDVLINNAGRSIRRPVRKSLDRFHDFERTIDLNYLGCVRLILGFLPMMKRRQTGHIINVSSIGCQANAPRFSAYVASKAALDGFSRCIASEVVHDNITVTTVYMPLVRTPMISPTKIYDHMPTLSPREAARMVLKPVATKQRKMSTFVGSSAEVLYGVSPRLFHHLLNIGYLVMPDSDTKDQPLDLSRAAKIFSKILRGVHW